MSRSSDPRVDRKDETPNLTGSERAWAERSELRWRRARAVVERYPHLDASDVYHALRCLELTPSQRLAAGLQRGRLRARTR